MQKREEHITLEGLVATLRDAVSVIKTIKSS